MEPFPWKLTDSSDVSPIRKDPYRLPRRIGYWMSPKKLKKMDMTKFAVVCRSAGYELVPVDFHRPLEEQGPFDVFLHKLTDMIVKAENNDGSQPEAVELFRVLETYLNQHPETIMVDPVENLKKLLRRQRQYHLIATSEACSHEKVFTPPFVELFQSDPEQMVKDLRSAHVQFPIVCKPQEAHGSSDAHRMMIIFNAAGLRSIKVPCVAQSFVNHDAVLYKVFVVGDIFHVVRRPSFENFDSFDLPPIAFDSQNIAAAQWLCDDSKVPQCPIAASSIPDTPGIYLPPELLKKIIKGIRKQFGLSLIGIDLIHDISTQRLAIIDVNAFPSYDGVPNFFNALFLHIHDGVVTRDRGEAYLSRSLTKVQKMHLNGISPPITETTAERVMER